MAEWVRAAHVSGIAKSFGVEINETKNSSAWTWTLKGWLLFIQCEIGAKDIKGFLCLFWSLFYAQTIYFIFYVGFLWKTIDESIVFITLNISILNSAN